MLCYKLANYKQRTIKPQPSAQTYLRFFKMGVWIGEEEGFALWMVGSGDSRGLLVDGGGLRAFPEVAHLLVRRLHRRFETDGRTDWRPNRYVRPHSARFGVGRTNLGLWLRH